MGKIAVISGGIGSGKSVVSRIVSALGYATYDCDSQAKSLMDNSGEIKLRIAEMISPDVISANGSIDRQKLAFIVFSNPDKLKILNGIVHGAVRDDVTRRVSEMPDNEYLFVETAIPHESGIDVMADVIIYVEAPLQVRVERVVRRSGLSEEQVLSRIDAQQGETAAIDANPDAIHILNDGSTPILPQIFGTLKSL
ncbi:MAG: dephospho-CoA kinase [Muribaculaceae bacterium]|nr:dephospho-CoA kinase [Muribaculaceae bacterium]